MYFPFPVPVFFPSSFGDEVVKMADLVLRALSTISYPSSPPKALSFSFAEFERLIARPKAPTSPIRCPSDFHSPYLLPHQSQAEYQAPPQPQHRDSFFAFRATHRMLSTWPVDKDEQDEAYN